MAEISFHFTIELNEEQKQQLQYIRQIAKMDNGEIIATIKEDKIDGYIIPKYRVELVNNFLDARSKSEKIKKPKFNLIAIKDKIIDEN